MEHYQYKSIDLMSIFLDDKMNVGSSEKIRGIIPGHLLQQTKLKHFPIETKRVADITCLFPFTLSFIT